MDNTERQYPSRERLIELLDYDPCTGIVKWRSAVNSGALKGSVAGTVNKNDGYIRIGIDNKLYLIHRIIWIYMTGSPPPNDIDHKNHIRIDNSWDNLRSVTRAENIKNCTLSKSNSSGFTGVIWHKGNKMWLARVMVDYKHIYLGYFDCKLDAIAERIRANKKYGFHINHGLKSGAVI